MSAASDVWFAFTTLAPTPDEHALPSPTPITEKLTIAFHDLRDSTREWVLQPLAQGLAKVREHHHKPSYLISTQIVPLLFCSEEIVLNVI